MTQLQRLIGIGLLDEEKAFIISNGIQPFDQIFEHELAEKQLAVTD